MECFFVVVFEIEYFVRVYIAAVQFIDNFYWYGIEIFINYYIVMMFIFEC